MTDELRELGRSLDGQRDAVLQKLEGVSDADARRTPTVSDLSLLTIVQHLTYVERRWFQVASAGRDIPGAFDRDVEFVARPDPVTSIIERYRDAIAESRAIATTFESADDACLNPDMSRNLRWVFLHMIEETARHAGHADIIRESIDGSAG